MPTFLESCSAVLLLQIMLIVYLWPEHRHTQRDVNKQAGER